jgi:hypothetical protein
MTVHRLIQSLSVILLLGMVACSNSADKRAVTLEELKAQQAEDQSEWEKYTPKRDILTAVELIALADCNTLSCVQLFMKDLSPDFFHGKKGEFSATHRSTVIDTAGNELIIPLSTFYVDVNPQAQWRAAHTVHTKALGDTLYNEFIQLGFEFVEEGYYLGIKSKQQRYVSKNYPDKSLYITATFNPWGFKGLYKNNVTWPCYVFEVYTDE